MNKERREVGISGELASYWVFFARLLRDNAYRAAVRGRGEA
jgi:hypothetical protein